RSGYLQALARKAGCRDHNDLWDHLFETRLNDSGASESALEKFVRDVAAWCHFARVDTRPEDLETDGTIAREAAMAGAIRDELNKGTERIVVVTGGFHTVVLPQLVATGKSVSRPPTKRKQDDALDCLIRYSFEQLDALNGYAAGM